MSHSPHRHLIYRYQEHEAEVRLAEKHAAELRREQSVGQCVLALLVAPAPPEPTAPVEPAECLCEREDCAECQAFEAAALEEAEQFHAWKAARR